MQPSLKQKIEVLKLKFSEDIELFGKYFLKNHLRLKTPEFHKEIFKLFEGTERRIAIAAPRGHSKSTLTDLVYLLWVIVFKKAKFILLISDTYSQAVLFMEALKAELEANELLNAWFGKLTSSHWSEGEIITNGIMIKCLGAGMKVRGLKFRENRPDLVIVDDLENEELTENKERREKLERWLNGAVMPALDKEGRMIMIGTIIHYDSLLMKILSPTSYQDFTKKIYKAIEDGKALWPEHLSIDELEKIKRDYIDRGQGYLFYQEYQNDPVSDESRKFKLEKFKYYKDEDLGAKLLNNYLLIDRAYSTEKTADSTGITILSVDLDNNWYVRISERFKGEESELINKIFDLKNFFNPDKVGIEQKAFKYTFKPTLEAEMRRRNNFFKVEELKDGGKSKNLRIEGLLPRFESGSLFIKKEQTDLIDEMIKFPKAVHDDLVDSLAYGLVLAKPPRANLAQGMVEEYDTYGMSGLN